MKRTMVNMDLREPMPYCFTDLPLLILRPVSSHSSQSIPSVTFIVDRIGSSLGEDEDPARQMFPFSVGQGPAWITDPCNPCPSVDWMMST